MEQNQKVKIGVLGGGRGFTLSQFCEQSDVAELVAARMGATVALEPWPAEALALESGSTVFDSSRLDGETANAGYRQIEESLDF